MSRSASIKAIPSGLGQLLQRLADRIGERQVAGNLLHRGLRLAVIVAEGEQRARHVALVAHAVARDDDLREVLLDEQALDAADHVSLRLAYRRRPGAGRGLG